MRGSTEYLTISTLSSLNVTYHVSLDSLNFTINGTVSKDRPIRSIRLPPKLRAYSSAFNDRFKGIRVTSDQPIRVSLFHSFFEHLFFPCHEYPGVNQYEYYTVSTSSSDGTTLSQALLISCRGFTNVTIIPSVDLLLPVDAQKSDSHNVLVTKGNAHVIILHEGQTLLLGKGGGSDISGTHIISNKPLTVITGHECGSVTSEHSRCQQLQLQVPPTITWGRRFILTNFINPFRNLFYSLYLKVIISQDNTTVTTYCDGTTNITKYSNHSAFGIYQYSIAKYCYMEADKPIFVVMFPYEKIYYTTGMVLITPMEQYHQEIEFVLSHHFKLVIIASAEGFFPATILYNGQAIFNWTAIYNYSSQNVVAFGTEIDFDGSRYQNHSHYLACTSRNGKLSVQVQNYYSYIPLLTGLPAVVSLQPGNQPFFK